MLQTDLCPCAASPFATPLPPDSCPRSATRSSPIEAGTLMLSHLHLTENTFNKRDLRNSCRAQSRFVSVYCLPLVLSLSRYLNVLSTLFALGYSRKHIQFVRKDKRMKLKLTGNVNCIYMAGI